MDFLELCGDICVIKRQEELNAALANASQFFSGGHSLGSPSSREFLKSRMGRELIIPYSFEESRFFSRLKSGISASIDHALAMAMTCFVSCHILDPCHVSR